MTAAREHAGIAAAQGALNHQLVAFAIMVAFFLITVPMGVFGSAQLGLQ